MVHLFLLENTKPKKKKNIVREREREAYDTICQNAKETKKKRYWDLGYHQRGDS
jgi:hypothetical protein